MYNSLLLLSREQFFSFPPAALAGIPVSDAAKVTPELCGCGPPDGAAAPPVSKVALAGGSGGGGGDGRVAEATAQMGSLALQKVAHTRNEDENGQPVRPFVCLPLWWASTS